MFLLDSHAHLSGEQLCNDAAGIMERALKAGLKAVVDICIDRNSLEKSLELQKQFTDSFFIALATTPHDAVKCQNPLKDEVYKLAQKKKIVASIESKSNKLSSARIS